MRCWACQGKMRCEESRESEGGKARRRRYGCTVCGEKTYTVERIVPREEWLKRMRKDLRERLL